MRKSKKVTVLDTLIICTCLLLGVFVQSMQIKATDMSGYDEAYQWLICIGYTEEMLADRTQNEIVDTYEYLRTKQEEYGRDIAVKVTNYSTDIKKIELSARNQRRVIEPEKLRLDSVYINYQSGDTIVGVEVDTYYKWLNKPKFLSEEDRIFLTWDASMFMVPSSHYVDYMSTATLKPNGKTVKVLLSDRYVGDLFQGGIGWPVSLSYPSAEVEYYSGKAFVSLKPRKVLKVGEESNYLFTLQYEHKVFPLENVHPFIMLLILGVLPTGVVCVLHRRCGK